MRAGRFVVAVVAFVVGVIALVGIQRAAPSGYNEAQTAEPAAFAVLVAEHHDDYLAANAWDFLFAASYAVFGVAVFTLLRGSVVAGFGSIFVVVGALADEIENVFLRIAIGRQSDGTDVATLLDVMHVFGWVKWGGIVAALLALVVRVGQLVASRR